jgi:hypothetical protein
MMRSYPKTFLTLGTILFVGPTVALTLLLMPVIPALQRWDSLAISYALYALQWWITGIGLVLLALSIPTLWSRSRWIGKTGLVVLVLVSVGLNVITRTNMTAEAMFNEPQTVQRVERSLDVALHDSTVYLWVKFNTSVAGYPLDLVAHHHKILDTVGGTPVLITYCTMCHTGRVFSPIVDGAVETFRLVGAHRFNAIFEDNSTGSWWYQATGECILGPRKGTTLADLDFVQGTAAEMQSIYGLSNEARVSTFVPDAATGDRYRWATGYSLNTGDTVSPSSPRSLVVGIRIGSTTRSYSVVDLVRNHARTTFSDTVDGVPILITVPATFNGSFVGYRDSVSPATKIPTVVDYRHAWEHFHQ